jgi:hypothetical protein
MARQAWDERLLKAYLERGRMVLDEEPGAEKLEWAYDAVCEITDSDDPEEVLPFVLALVDMSPDEVLMYVAAGPLEDILRKHGGVVIERIVKVANLKPKLRRALEGVWGIDDMDPAVGKCLDAARRRWYG